MFSEQDNKETQRLQTLGLTLNQARVYLALLKAEKLATAKALSVTSGLAACDIYRIVPELVKLGLLEVLVTSPKEFRAVPPADATEILITQRKKEVENLSLTAKKFIEELHLGTKSETSEFPETALIPGGHRATQFGLPKLLATKAMLDAVQTNASFRRFASSNSESLEALLEKRVKMRFVIESAAGLEVLEENLVSLLKNGFFKLRFAKKRIQACVMLHDDTDVFLNTSLDPVHSTFYWSNNSCFAAVVRNYFETMWAGAVLS
jgi:hypothetical protein